MSRERTLQIALILFVCVLIGILLVQLLRTGIRLNDANQELNLYNTAVLDLLDQQQQQADANSTLAADIATSADENGTLAANLADNAGQLTQQAILVETLQANQWPTATPTVTLSPTPIPTLPVGSILYEHQSGD